MLEFDDIKKMRVSQLIQNEEFKEQFMFIYCASQSQTKAQAQAFFEREMAFLARMFDDDVKLRTATPVSVYLSLLDLAFHALSIEPIPKAQAYIYLNPKNIAPKGQPENWEQRAVYKISAYGELTLRVRSNVIKYADNPVLVYEGDYFEPIDGVVHHTAKRISKKITDAYIKITRDDGSVDYKYFSMDEIYSFKAQSKSKGSVAWTGGVEGQPTRGMIDAKVIKHAFSTYPRLVVGGRNTQLETNELAGEAAYAAVLGNMAGAPEEVAAPIEKKAAPPSPFTETPAETHKEPEAKQEEMDPYWAIPMGDYQYGPPTEDEAPASNVSPNGVPDFDI